MLLVSDIDKLKAETLSGIDQARAIVAETGCAGGSPRSTLRALDRLSRRLGRTLRLGIAGEFNTGKSSLCNRLVGVDSLPTAAIANTNCATRIYYANDFEIFLVERSGKRLPGESNLDLAQVDLFRIDVGLPATQLQRIELIDFPGLADPRFSRSTADLLAHHVDVLLWCTASMQAWKESERAAWSMLPDRLKSRSVLALTHRDLIADAEDEARLIDRLQREFGPDFHAILPVSTRPSISDTGEIFEENDGIRSIWSVILSLTSDIELERISRAAVLSNGLVSRCLAPSAAATA